MHPDSSERHYFTVIADHGQFYLQDLEAHGSWVRSNPVDPVPAGWTHEAVRFHRIAAEPHSIAVGTARSDLVEVTLLFGSTAPTACFGNAEHVVEADLHLPNGDLAVFGPEYAPGDERHIGAAAGHYRTWVSYIPCGPPAIGANAYEFGDHFHYCFELWPTGGPAALAVVRQGPSPWAG